MRAYAIPGVFRASQSPCVRRATQKCRGGRASLVDFALMLGSLHLVCESDKRAAAVRSTGLRLLHFSNPEGFRGYQPCRYLRYHYRIVMTGKIFFARILLRQLGRHQLYYYNIVTGDSL
jgi:hypothetical protein